MAFGHSLGACIVEHRRFLGIFDPGRNQAPAHHCPFPYPARLANEQHVLCGSDVVMFFRFKTVFFCPRIGTSCWLGSAWAANRIDTLIYPGSLL
jgi:hypothetical protein